jgi:hypothetical protein
MTLIKKLKIDLSNRGEKTFITSITTDVSNLFNMNPAVLTSSPPMHFLFHNISSGRYGGNTYIKSNISLACGVTDM